jgi:hypothetical protein
MVRSVSVLAQRADSEGPRLGEERVSARSGGRVRMGRAVAVLCFVRREEGEA